MNDQNLMENLLLLEKGVCDLYLHGTIESANETVHGTFRAALTESLCMQDTLYSKMAAKGWYPPAQADANQITAVKQKFSTSGQSN